MWANVVVTEGDVPSSANGWADDGIPATESCGGVLQVRFRIRTFKNANRRVPMLWTIFVVLIILWLLGFSLHIGGALIHLLLVIGLVVLIFNLVSGRRTV
jgi:hypothetical protein